MTTTGQYPDGVYYENCEDSFCVIQVRLTEDKYPSDLEGYRAYIGYDKKNGVSFIVDSGPSASDANIIIQVYEQKVGSTIPTFMYCTHGHPDHLGGYNTLSAKWPTTPIYIGVRGVLDGMNYFTPGAAYLSKVQILNKDLSYWGAGSVVNVVDFPSMETTYASMLYLNVYDEKILFSGDIWNPRSHLYVSNGLNGWGSYPYIDDALCQWAAKLISLQCTLDDDIVIYPGHGPSSDEYEDTSGLEWREAMQETVNWIKEYRQVAYNTCNATYAWRSMIQKYPHYGLTIAGYYSYGLINWFPAAANAMNCNCVAAGSDGTYPIYTPNNCQTSSTSLPRCAVLDTSYSMDARCAMIGATAQTAYLSSFELNENSNDDTFTSSDGEVLFGITVATLIVSFILLLMFIGNFIIGRRRVPLMQAQGGNSDL